MNSNHLIFLEDHKQKQEIDNLLKKFKSLPNEPIVLHYLKTQILNRQQTIKPDENYKQTNLFFFEEQKQEIDDFLKKLKTLPNEPILLHYLKTQIKIREKSLQFYKTYDKNDFNEEQVDLVGKNIMI